MATRLRITEAVFSLVDEGVRERLPSTAELRLDRDGYVYLRGWSEEYQTTVTVSLHRRLLGSPDGLVVDHINGDRLDNRLENLRLATHAQNSRNRKKPKRTSAGRVPTSQFKGVCKTASGKWQAQIKHAGRSIHIGTFASEEAAARAYDRNAKTFYGEFALLNYEY